MQSAIEITTLTGVRLDVYADETIELNMGGVSLLSLEQRTVSYTNSFKMPRTPTNEAVFQFASHPERNNRPTIDVWVRKGFFEKKAVLKVMSFDKDYFCSISYESVFDIIKEQYMNVFDDYVDTVILDTTTLYPEQVLQAMYDYANYLGLDGDDKEVDGFYCFPIRTNTLAIDLTVIPETALPATSKYFNIFSSLQVFLKMGAALNGFTVDGDIFSDVYFQKAVVQNNSYLFAAYGRDDTPIAEVSVEMKIATDPNLKKISYSQILKAVAQIWGCEINVSENNISINKIENLINASQIPIEGFTWSKNITSGYAKDNRIIYDAKNKDKVFFGSDVFQGDGVGEKEVLKINAIIPDTDAIGYVTDMETVNGAVMIGVVSDVQTLGDGSLYVTAPLMVDDFTVTANVNYREFVILSMDGVYSNILDPIFTNPVILKATRHFSPVEANSVMTNRIITSVQLGGTYWVDDMAYNLSTGNTVMTLIKIR